LEFQDPNPLEQYVYINFTADGALPFVEILGKTDTLQWLQEFKVKGMMVEEFASGVIQAELTF